MFFTDGGTLSSAIFYHLFFANSFLTIDLQGTVKSLGILYSR